MGLDQLFDKYSLRARHVPTVLVVLGPLTVASLLFPKVWERMSATAGSLGLGVGVGAVLLFFISHVLRQRGRAIERKLTAKDGGLPTTCWLRLRDTNIDPVTKARYHAYLAKNVPDLQVPTLAQEQQQPSSADNAYRSAVNWLLKNRRDTTHYPLVLEENVQYGFRRNMLGGKWIAISLCVVPLIGTYAWAAYQGSPPPMNTDHIAALSVAALAVLGWLFFVTEAWVRDASQGYARALLATCEA